MHPHTAELQVESELRAESELQVESKIEARRAANRIS